MHSSPFNNSKLPANPRKMSYFFSNTRINLIRNQLLAVAFVALVCALQLPNEALAHAKGMYQTQAEAEKRAKELGCKGTHQNNGLWMPCSGGSMLQKELRQE
jgi:hypothetical protein